MPRISAANIEEHREQVHQRVFDAFAELMAERSYDAITMAQIAARAGLGRTAIYHHFRDKEAVVAAFAGHETARYVAGLEDALATSGSATDRLRTYVDHQLTAGEQFHMGLGPQLYGALPPESRQAIRGHVLEVEQVLRRILTDGVETGEFTVADLDGTLSLIHACLGPRHLPVATVEAFVLRAVGANA